MRPPPEFQPIEWLNYPERRVDRTVERFFDRAFEKARTKAAKLADERRRNIARMQDAPRFPADWGRYLVKNWIVPAADGGSFVSTIAPTSGVGLTVWRFADFEVTATFDSWRMDIDVATGGWGLSFQPEATPGRRVGRGRAH